MAEDAVVRLTYDATGAKAGADAFAAASSKVLAANDAIEKATLRVATSSTGTSRALDSMARRLDPFGSAVRQAASDLDRLQRIAQSSGDNAARATDLIAAAQQRLVTAQKALADSTSGANGYAKRAADIAAYGTELDRLRTKFDPVFAASRQYEAALAEVNDALKVGAINEQQHAAAIERATAAYAAANAPLQGYLSNTEKLYAAMARASEQSQRTATIQGQYNSLLGVRGTSADDYAKRSADIAAYGAELDRLRAKFNPVFAASKQYESVLNEIAEAQRVGAISAKEAEAAQGRATAIFAAANQPLNKVSESAGNAAFATRQFGVQMVQTISSIASGQPVLTTFIQQGHQIVDVSLATGTGLGVVATAARAVWAALTSPVGLAITGIAAVTGAVVGLGAASESAARQTLQLQTQLRATRDDYAAMAAEVRAAAKDIAATTGISTSDALAAGKTIAANPNFAGTQAQLEGLIRTAANLDAVLGKTGQGAEMLAKALEDPGSVAKQLADSHFPGMSQALAYSIKLMADGGDKAGAFSRALEVMQTTTRGANDNLTPLQRAIKDLDTAFTTAGQNGRSLADVLGSAITSAAATAVEAVTGVVNAINRLRQTGAQAIPNTPQGAAALVPDATGRPVLRSDAGALGVMQVMPGTAAQFGLNPNFLDQNILAGLSYIQQLSKQFSGEAAIAGAYNLGPNRYQSNPTAAAGYIGRVAGANPSSLPADIASQIEYWGQVLGLSPQMIALGQRIAVVESGGRQYGTFTPQVSSPAALTLPGSAAALAGAGLGGIEGGIAQLQSGNLLNAAFQAYLGSGALSVQRGQNQAQQNLLQQGIAAAQQVGDVDQVNKLTEALAKLKGEESGLITEQDKLARSAVDATRELSAQAGFTRTMAGIEQQFAEAARASGQAVDQKALALAKAAEQTKLATDFSDAIEATNRATEAQLRINAAYDGSAQSLSKAQNYEKAYAQALQDFDSKSPDFTRHVQDYADALNRGSDASLALQQHQQALQSIASAVTSAFDQISQGITNSLLSGTGAAVNWRNVMVSVAQQVLSAFIKLAVINPILNSLFAQNNSTLGSVIGALGSSGGSSGAGTSSGGLSFNNLSTGAGLLSKLSNIGSISDLFGPTGLFGAEGGIANGALNASQFVFGPNSGITQFLASPVIGSVSPAATSSALDALGSGVFGPETASAYTAAGGTIPTSVSGIIGGVGAGFGLGSLAGGFIQSALGKVGPAPTIGAGAGAAAGAAIGSIIPGIGTVLGAIIGGLLGGGGGGLIGPKAPTPFTSTVLTTNQGLLGQLNSANQIYPSNADQTAQEIAQINNALQTLGVRISDVALAEGKLFQVGADKARPDLVGSTMSGPDVASIFNTLRFTAPNDQQLTGFLAGKSFASLQDFATTVQQFQADEAAITKFLSDLDTTFNAMGKTTGSLNDQIAQINDQWNAAITQATTYASNVAATTEQVARLTQAETDLANARDAAIQKAQQAVYGQIGDQINQTNMQTALAAAQRTGNPAQIRDVALWQANYQQWQAATAVYNQFQQIFGSGGWTQEAINLYMQAQDAVEKQFGEARLAIAKQYNDAIVAQQAQTQAQSLAAAQNTVTSLANYVRGLQTGSASPLSPSAQYDFASRQFAAVSGAALAGNANSIQQLPTYSDALLSASRSYYGSGAGYAADFQRVINTINRALPATADQLTALTFTAETRTQTQVLSGDLNDLKSLLQSLLTAVQQNNSRPVRQAA